MEKFQSLADVLGVPDPRQPELPVAPRPDKITVGDFCHGVLHSTTYRESLMRRILMDSLPPAVECLMYHYAYGKPVERLEHSGPGGGPIESKVIILPDNGRDVDVVPVP
jgi:hypothetical protein